MTKKVCAFTGHRPNRFPWKNDESAPACKDLISLLSNHIQNLIDEGITSYLSGMAEGSDTWAAICVLKLREQYPAIKLHAILPYRNQAEKWTDLSRERYNSILNQADSIIYVNRDFSKNCMLERNHFLVDHADTLTAIYDGRWRSGTAATVRYAQKAGRDIWIINPVTLQINHL